MKFSLRQDNKWERIFFGAFKVNTKLCKHKEAKNKKREEKTLRIIKQENGDKNKTNSWKCQEWERERGSLESDFDLTVRCLANFVLIWE